MKTFKLLLIVGLILSIASLSPAQDAARSASIVKLSGAADVMMPDGKWVEARDGMAFPEGVLIKTRDASSVTLSIDGRRQTALVELKANTSVAVAELSGSPTGSRKTLLDLAIGDVLVKVKKMPQGQESKFEIRTPISYIGVRGTVFSVSLKKK